MSPDDLDMEGTKPQFHAQSKSQKQQPEQVHSM